MIEKLYEASNAGVKIDLIVRGICMLRPGVPGLSENITVRNIVDRFLEHSRVFYFAIGGDEEFYISSADWMARNLKHRIEVVAPVSDRDSPFLAGESNRRLLPKEERAALVERPLLLVNSAGILACHFLK